MKQLFHFFVAGLLAIAIPVTSHAEGTKEASPTSTDLTGLFYATPTTNNQGSYFGCPAENRIKFRIKDFTTEKLYFGFNLRTFVNSGGTSAITNGYYRIINASGTVVAGPTAIPSSAAAGYISNYTEAVAGPNIGGSNASGYTPFVFTPTANEEYYIEYYRSTNSGVSMSTSVTNSRMVCPFWDFTVATGTGATASTKLGRVYCQKWGMCALNTSFQCTLNTSSDGLYYALTSDSIVMKLDLLPGFRPKGYDLTMNFYGITNSGNWFNDRKSITFGATAPSLANGYKVFLNVPDPSLPENAIAAVPLAPTLLNPNITGCAPPYRIRIRANSTGDYAFALDLNGVPGYQPNTVDRLIEVGYSNAGIVAYNWDGKNGLGNLVPSGSSFPIITTMRKGRINWPIYDAEQNFGGMRIEAVAPIANSSIPLYWDDTQLTDIGTVCDGSVDNIVTGPGRDSSLNGMPSPSHMWDGPIAGGGGSSTGSLDCDDFGNVRVINTWAFGFESSATQIATLACTSFYGKVWQDADASAAGTYSNIFTTGEVGTNGGGLFAILVDPNSGEVIESVAVSASGDFLLNKVPLNTTGLVIRLSTVAGVETNYAPNKSIPNNWTATSPDTLLFNSGSSPLPTYNFGIQQRPIATDGSYPNRFNPFGLTYVNIPSTLFTGTDPDAGGQITTFNFTGYPANVDNFYINGVVYTAATWPVGGVQVVAVGNALPAGIIKIDPAAGFLGNTNIPYTVSDKAGTTSVGPNNVNVSFAGVLPVRILSFNGSLNNGVTKLNWLVASQSGTAKYFVERRAENGQWNEIGSVKAINQAGNISYNFDDVNPLSGYSYYRLRIVDWDGAFQYSTIVKIAKNIDYSFNVTVYPNPVKEKLSIAITSDKQDNVSITLFDNTGKLVMIKKIDLQVGNNTVIVDEIATFAKGLYMVRVSNEQGTLASTKVLKD